MAAYIEITYEISSTTSPTVIFAKNKGGWIDSIRYGSVTGNVITLEGSGNSYTFPSTGVQKLYFFSSGTSVGPDAFAIANGSDYKGLPYLTGIKTDFPDNELTSLGESSFYFCSGLTSVSISNLTSLGQLCFYNCKSLQQITLPTNLTVIPSELFVNCFSLTSVTFGPYITRIEDHAFTSLAYGRNMNLREIIRPANRSNITYIGPAAFAGNPYLQNVNNILDDGLTAIESQTFTGDSSISTLVIPDSVSAIGSVAFYACSGLTEVHLGSGLTELSTSSFRGCSSLSSITATSKNAQTVDSTSFRDVHTGGTLYYPEGYESEYGSNGWLSADEYYLGYYDWNGVATGDTPTPSGDTPDTGSTSGDTSGSTSGDTSGSTSGDTSGYTPATGSCIEVTYDTSLYNGYTISSWPSGTKILGGSGAVQSDYSAMIYTGWIDHAEFEDGTPIPSSQYRTGFYDFEQEGIYTIRYYTNGQDVTYGIPLLPEYSFQDCGRVVSVKIIHSGDSTKDIQAIGGKAFAKTSLACITLPEGIRDIDTYAFSEVDTLSCITFPASLANPVSQYYPSIAGWVLESATSLNKIFAKGMTAPPIGSKTFEAIPSGGTLYYPVGSDYSTWLDALPQNWTWAIYDPYAVDTCDCAHDGENVPIIESGTTNPPSGTPYISLSGYSNNYLAATGSCVSLPIIATNCTYSSFTATIDYNPNLTAHSVASVTEENGSLKLCLTSNPLTGDAQVAIITVTLYDTNGNSYLHYLGLNQYGNTGPQPPIPSGQTIDSGSTSHTITYSGCPLVFDHSASTGTWNTLPTVTTGGTTDDWWITYDVPANDTDSARTITYYYLRYSGETCEDLVDTVSYTISQAAGSGTPTPSDRWIYLNPSGRTYAVGDAYSGSFFIKSSGCSIDSAYTPTCTFSGDTSWISTIENLRWLSYQNAFVVVYPVTRNLTTNNREVYITVNGVHDTDGNVYNGLVFHATQGWGDYVFLNYNETNPSSAGTTDTVEVVPVNTTICSVAVESAYTYTPEFWDGEQPTITLLGNYMTVVWPENPYASLRGYDIDLRVVWGENCENSTVLHYNKYQDAATAPVQKDIKAADTDYSVGSGTGNASTTVQVSGCTYDHFTYITGGSFSVTATSGPNNTIVFTYPENPTTSPRTGYVYITFYDSDGNAYGPQTITFTQQAGSSPGPGPGPDPSTGYVLTTLTISDQEQHRYFVEARPGVVYSAAGQYYKTILACEARYSLYYVNSYGGVDVLPLKGGGQKKTDNITRFNYSRSFRNNTPEFENVNYMNEIKAVWELQTGWIGDDGSSRMHELVESTIVYLYDAEEKTYTPVVMTDKKLEYKTYRNQGRKFYNYTVNVEESQSKERR